MEVHTVKMSSNYVITGNSFINEDELYHYGIKGMRWGIRRYQNPDGSYTSAGKKRYIADKTAKMQRDIDSYEPIRNGLKDKKGRQILTKDDVTNSVNALKSQKAKKRSKAFS